MRRLRRNLTKEEIAQKSRAITARLLRDPAYRMAKTVCVYLSAFREPDTDEIILRALADGKRVVVPVTDQKNRTLSLSELKGLEAVVTGAYGIREPEVFFEAFPECVDLILVPGLAFSKTGARLGFGEGYYDRLLCQMSCIKIGICYAFQVTDALHEEAHDIPMNRIITESRVIDCDAI